MGGNLKQGFGLNAGGGSGGGGANTNIANDDLTSDGNHTLDVAATTLTVDSGATEVLKLNGTNDTVVIGPSGADYSMPVTRGTDLDVLMSNGAGAASWQSRRETIDIQAYNDNIANTTNYFYAVPMTNNKYKSLCNVDIGASATESLATSAVLRGGYYVVNRPMIIRKMTGWGTCNIAATCEIVIIKYTPVNGGATPLRGTQVGSGTITGGASNLKMAALTTGILASSDFLVGDILIPMIRLTGDIETEENVLVFNLTLELG